MRISSNTIYETGTAQLGALQVGMAKTQAQISTGRRITTAADDPIGASRALEITQSQSINTQLATNRQNAKSSLSQVELALNGATTLIQDVQVLAINAGNGILSSADRVAIATELSGRLDDMLGLANTADGAGGYLFSGYKSTTLPFTPTATGAQYQGDQGQRILQVGSSRQMPVSDSGNSIFEGNITGNGTFVTAAGTVPVNTGSGIISSGSVTNATLLTSHNYSVDFAVAAGATTYSVYDLTLDPTKAAPLAAAVPYTSGQPISFDGLTFQVNGSPADLDTFSVQPSTKQSIFTTLSNLITLLKAPSSGAVGQAALTNGLNTANDNINKALDNVLSVRSSVGSRLKELDYLDNAGEDLNIQYAATLADLQDLDYTKALSQFAQEQITLEAAQKSYIKISGLSLFNFIS